jgi:RNA polymerase sigma-70 factor, ECF subfamily
VDELTVLLERARRGDDDAFAIVVRTMYPAISRLCRHVAGPSGADDATQETFLAAWRSLPAFRGESSARTWLFVIARRTAVRVAARHRRWSALADAAPGTAPFAHPETSLEVDELLRRLPDDRRTALFLTQVVGLSYAEAAQVCDCAVGTIRSRVARARAQLLEQTDVQRVRDTGSIAGS